MDIKRSAQTRNAKLETENILEILTAGYQEFYF